jgi:hypothetical protein
MRLRFERFLWAMPAIYALHLCKGVRDGLPSVDDPSSAGIREPGERRLIHGDPSVAVGVGELSTWRLSAFLFLGWASGNLFWNFIFRLGTTAGDGVAARPSDLALRRGSWPSRARRRIEAGGHLWCLCHRRRPHAVRHAGPTLAFSLAVGVEAVGAPQYAVG